MERYEAGTLQIFGESHRIYNGMNIIGRDLDATIILRDLKISKKHIIISVLEDKHYVTDTGSSNGTKLGSTKLIPFVFYELKDNAVLTLGDIVGIYHIVLKPDKTKCIPAEKKVFLRNVTLQLKNDSIFEVNTQKLTPDSQDSSSSNRLSLPKRQSDQLYTTSTQIPDHEICTEDATVSKNIYFVDNVKNANNNEKKKEEVDFATNTSSNNNDNLAKSVIPIFNQNALISQVKMSDDNLCEDSLLINDSVDKSMCDIIVDETFLLTNKSTATMCNNESSNDSIDFLSLKNDESEPNYNDDIIIPDSQECSSMQTKIEKSYLLNKNSESDNLNNVTKDNEKCVEDSDSETDIEDNLENVIKKKNVIKEATKGDKINTNYDYSSKNKESDEADFTAPTQLLNINRKEKPVQEEFEDGIDFLAPTQKLSSTINSDHENAQKLSRTVSSDNEDSFLAPTQPLNLNYNKSFDINKVNTHSDIEDDVDFLAPTQKLSHSVNNQMDTDFLAPTQKLSVNVDDIDFLMPTQKLILKKNPCQINLNEFPDSDIVEDNSVSPSEEELDGKSLDENIDFDAPTQKLQNVFKTPSPRRKKPYKKTVENVDFSKNDDDDLFLAPTQKLVNDITVSHTEKILLAATRPSNFNIDDEIDFLAATQKLNEANLNNPEFENDNNNPEEKKIKKTGKVGPDIDDEIDFLAPTQKLNETHFDDLQLGKDNNNIEDKQLKVTDDDEIDFLAPTQILNASSHYDKVEEQNSVEVKRNENDLKEDPQSKKEKETANKLKNRPAEHFQYNPNQKKLDQQINKILNKDLKSVEIAEQKTKKIEEHNRVGVKRTEKVVDNDYLKENQQNKKEKETVQKLKNKRSLEHNSNQTKLDQQINKRLNKDPENVEIVQQKGNLKENSTKKSRASKTSSKNKEPKPDKTISNTKRRTTSRKLTAVTNSDSTDSDDSEIFVKRKRVCRIYTQDDDENLEKAHVSLLENKEDSMKLYLDETPLEIVPGCGTAKDINISKIQEPETQMEEELATQKIEVDVKSRPKNPLIQVFDLEKTDKPTQDFDKIEHFNEDGRNNVIIEIDSQHETDYFHQVTQVIGEDLTENNQCVVTTLNIEKNLNESNAEISIKNNDIKDNEKEIKKSKIKSKHVKLDQSAVEQEIFVKRKRKSANVSEEIMSAINTHDRIKIDDTKRQTRNKSKKENRVLQIDNEQAEPKSKITRRTARKVSDSNTKKSEESSNTKKVSDQLEIHNDKNKNKSDENKKNNLPRKRSMRSTASELKFDEAANREISLSDDSNNSKRLKSNSDESLNKEDSVFNNTLAFKGRKRFSSKIASESPKVARKPVTKIVFTMLDDTNLEKVVKRLGGSIVETSDACTTLVTTKISRSLKFLKAVALGKTICGPEWIIRSDKANSFLDPADHILKDNDSEERFGFVLRDSIMRAKEKKLMEGFIVQLLVSKNADVLKELVEISGGKCVARSPTRNATNFIIVSYKEDRNKYKKFLTQKPPIKVVAAEAIFCGVLKQEFNLIDYLLT